MCAGCPGGRAVSGATAYINLHRLKPTVLRELQERVGRKARISVFGDRWVLTSRTGKREIFDDVEASGRGANRVSITASSIYSHAPFLSLTMYATYTSSFNLNSIKNWTQ